MLKIVKFLQEVKSELKKVTWPTQSLIIKMTLVVVATSLIVGLFLAGVDFIFNQLMSLII
mgnify:CR=1 FL=1